VYGSSAGRALYGMGDYQSRSGYAGGYYAAGGFFSGLKKLAKSKLGQMGLKGLSFAVPGIGSAISAGVNLAAGNRPSLGDFLVPGYSNVMKGGLLGSKLGTGFLKNVAFPGGKSSIGAPRLAKMGGGRLRAVETPRRRRKKAGTRARRRGGATTRRRGSKRGRGDWGDDGGRDKRGHFLSARGGHRNFKRRRRSRRPGSRVSFTTKSGKRVSFTAR